MTPRPHAIFRALLTAALALAMLGSTAALATAANQHDPHPPVTATLAATPAATPLASPAASGTDVLSVDEARAVAVEGQPIAISPDGKWLAGPGPDRGFCLWEVATLAPTCASDRDPLPVQPETITWAPDSSAVAFSLDAARLLVDSDIYVMDTDGTLRDLTDDGDDDDISLGSDAPNVPVDMYPAWSPDSSQLLFSRTTWSGDVKNTAIAVVDRAGGTPEQRFVVSPQEPFIIYSPMHWLADGSVIFSVMHADPDDAQNGVWRLTASGGVERIIAGDTSAAIPMPFVNEVSPDGTLATVLSMSRAGQFPMEGEPISFIVDLDSGETMPVELPQPGSPARFTAPGAFLPDGRGVLSVAVNGNEPSLVLSGLDGGVLGSAALPEDAIGPATYRGLSIADDGTVFLSTLATTEANGRGGFIITLGPGA